MKPLRLELTAFGPFGDAEVIDFAALPTDRPFVISGPTGAGKSSIFDAMTYALYGVLPGRRRGQKGPDAVRSDFAEAQAECSVSFQFEAHAQRWRVSRRPLQVRASKRGSGMAKVQAGAVLERFHHDHWVPVDAKATEVSARCQELVGLSAEQFQRVVLLPQGEFAEVLDASTDERERLLRTLFGTSVYADAVARLQEQRRDLLAGIHSTDQQCQGRLAAVVGNLRSAEMTLREHVPGRGDPRSAPPGALEDLLAGNPTGGDRPPAPVIELSGAKGLSSFQRRSLADGARKLGSVDGEEISTEGIGALLEPALLAQQLLELRDGALVELSSKASAAQELAGQHEEAYQSAKRIAADIEERDRQLAALAELDREMGEVDAVAAALESAAIAEPVIEAMEERERLATEVADTSAAACAAWAEAVSRSDEAGWHLSGESSSGACEQAIEEMLLLGSRLEQADVDLRRATELRQAANTAYERAEELRERRGRDQLLVQQAGDERDRLAAQVTEMASLADMVVAAERGCCEAELLVELVAARDTAIRHGSSLAERRIALADLVGGLLNRIGVTRERLAAVDGADRAAPAIREELDRAAARVEAFDRVKALLEELDRAEVLASEAEAAAQGRFVAYLSAAAPRLAAQLREGEPCSVCGSLEHPRPAASRADDPPVELSEVELARDQAAAAATTVAGLRRELHEVMRAEVGIAQEDRSALVAEIRRCEQALDRVLANAREGEQLRLEVEGLQVQLNKAQIDLAEVDREAHESSLELARTLGSLGDRADLSAEEAADRLQNARDERDRAAAAAEALGPLRSRQEHVEASCRELHEGLSEADKEIAVLQERRSALEQDAARAEASARSLCDHGDPSVRRPRLAGAVESLRAASGALGLAREAGTRHAGSAATVARRLARSPFADEAEARSASMPAEQRRELRGRVDAWRGSRRRVEAALELLAAQDLPLEAPDVDALAAAAATSAAVAQSVRERVSLTEAHLRSAEEQLHSVEAILERSASTRQRAELLERVCSVLAGHNSEQRVTLEAWVLRSHLGEVVVAANEHLRRLSHGRFQLELGSGHVRGQAKTGLDLVVMDAFSGRTRRTTSLSGGETFQASMSLALGLADVLTASQGGRRIDALFIDEGFGSLDADAVEQAISLLDGLRSRGVMVGVITHLEPLKEALEVALEVEAHPQRRGSTIRQRRSLAVA